MIPSLGWKAICLGRCGIGMHGRDAMHCVSTAVRLYAYLFIQHLFNDLWKILIFKFMYIVSNILWRIG